MCHLTADLRRFSNGQVPLGRFASILTSQLMTYPLELPLGRLHFAVSLICHFVCNSTWCRSKWVFFSALHLTPRGMVIFLLRAKCISCLSWEICYFHLKVPWMTRENATFSMVTRIFLFAKEFVYFSPYIITWLNIEEKQCIRIYDQCCIVTAFLPIIDKFGKIRSIQQTRISR